MREIKQNTFMGPELRGALDAFVAAGTAREKAEDAEAHLTVAVSLLPELDRRRYAELTENHLAQLRREAL